MTINWKTFPAYIWLIPFLAIPLFSQDLEDLSFGDDNSLDIATWNIEWFPKNGQITVEYVTEIIEQLDLDILAIQEVDDTAMFDQMLVDLPAYTGYYESVWFAGLAYIYKTEAVGINDIYEIYTTSPYWSAFPRSPMVMDISFMGENYFLINNHFKCCGDGIIDFNNESDEEKRRYDASNFLKEYIDTNLSDKNVIVLGDLNDDIAEAPQNNVFQMILDDPENYLFADLEIANGSTSEWSCPTWPSHLDHILITNELFDELGNSDIQTIKIDEYLDGGWNEYDQYISNHRPVAVKFIFSQIPSIESIEPAFGGIGNTIIINGGNFSSSDEDNRVFFGGLEATILNATANELMATVPYGAYYTPISVYTNGLYAASSQRFNVTFNATEELTVAHLSNQLDNPYLGAKYYDIKIADLNGDEIPEIVTSEAGSGSSAYLAIFTTSFDGEGMISIDDRLEINFGTGVYSEPHDIALGDLNGDGLLDVVVSEYGDITDDFESHTCIFINTSQNHSFSFDSPIIIEGDGYEAYAQLQDINGDGKLDIVTIRGSSWSKMNVYINTTQGNEVSFANKVIIEDYADPRPVFGDLNGDGMIDMVSTANTTDRRDVYIYSNTSTEENIDFSLELIVQSGGEDLDGYSAYDWSAYSPTLADIDGDGRLDIIVANGTCSLCSPSGISILRNTSTDSELLFEYDYIDFYQYQSNSLPVGIDISDLNGDGKPDILTNDWMGGISIMVNTSTEGNIILEEQMELGIGSFPLSIATADLNMDFTPEIVVSNWEVEGLRVIHNFLPVDEQTDNLPYDINSDGVVNISDFEMLLSFVIVGNDSVSAADINFDSEVDIFDLLLLSDYLQDM